MSKNFYHNNNVFKVKLRILLGHRMSFRRGALKYFVDENFFSKWTRNTAYLLGFTFADGIIYKTSLSWDLQSKDVELLRKVKRVLKSTYPITTHRGKSYRMRVSNQTLIQGAVEKGLLPKKNMRKTIPKIPSNLFRHFVRGYLDGDGWVVVRNSRNEANVGFCSGNKKFLKTLNKAISSNLKIEKGRVRSKHKVTPKGTYSTTYSLEFYSTKAFQLARWVYGDLNKRDLFLKRKYEKYLEAKKLYEYLKSGSRGMRKIQKRFGRSIKHLLEEIYVKQGKDGVQTATVLGIHSSSVYRWLAKTGIKYPLTRKMQKV